MLNVDDGREMTRFPHFCPPTPRPLMVYLSGQALDWLDGGLRLSCSKNSLFGAAGGLFSSACMER